MKFGFYFILFGALCASAEHSLAAGGSEEIYFQSSGWSLQLTPGNGSSAYLTRGSGSHMLAAQIKFEQYADYALVLFGLPTISQKAAAADKRKCFIVETDTDGTEHRHYYSFSAVEGLMALFFFQHRGSIYADDPEAFRKAFIETPPLPIIRDWQTRPVWTQDFQIHQLTKDAIP